MVTPVSRSIKYPTGEENTHPVNCTCARNRSHVTNLIMVECCVVVCCVVVCCVLRVGLQLVCWWCVWCVWCCVDEPSPSNFIRGGISAGVGVWVRVSMSRNHTSEIGRPCQGRILGVMFAVCTFVGNVEFFPSEKNDSSSSLLKRCGWQLPSTHPLQLAQNLPPLCSV